MTAVACALFALILLAAGPATAQVAHVGPDGQFGGPPDGYRQAGPLGVSHMTHPMPSYQEYADGSARAELADLFLMYSTAETIDGHVVRQCVGSRPSRSSW
jgi:hypothetical protein